MTRRWEPRPLRFESNRIARTTCRNVPCHATRSNLFDPTTTFDNEYKRVREIHVVCSRRIPVDDSWNVGNFEKGWQFDWKSEFPLLIRDTEFP